MVQKLNRSLLQAAHGRNGGLPIRATKLRVLDPAMSAALIRDRQQRGIDRDDEVWDGVYVMPPLATNWHQDIVGDLVAILRYVLPAKVRVQPGANVSDHRSGWDQNYRCPDIVVVFPGGRAEDCGTHWFGGPDFLVEIRSPKDETLDKLTFYSGLEVRELLVIDRDRRGLMLFRHDGAKLTLTETSTEKRREWVRSAVVPLAFRWRDVRGKPRTDVRRTDGKRKTWTI
jgi:Uma2 family endonuclease